MSQLAGKVAIVTGGNSGIGRATAIAFAREGAAVVIAARDEERGAEVEREIRAAGGEAWFVPTDVALADDVEALVTSTVHRHGRLDIAFNNAGIASGAMRPLADFDEAEFDRTIAVNLKSVWLCMKHQIRHMLARTPTGGVIVNTSSVNGLGGAASGAIYSASKAGVLALTKSAAQEYGRQHIRVNALVAGAFRTPMLERVFERAADGDPARIAGVAAGYEALTALGRIGDPAEAADAVVWLCSDAARYVTGHSLIVDGGMTAAIR
jgi:NAD(P)-dependent dehydrogenase (short-subunit alcohol dehydrogenase family)